MDYQAGMKRGSDAMGSGYGNDQKRFSADGGKGGGKGGKGMQSTAEWAVDQAKEAEQGWKLVVIQVPQTIVGKVIGRQGETVRFIQKSFGARLNVDQTTSMQGFSTISICGLPEAVQKSKESIHQIIHTCDPNAKQGDAPSQNPPWEAVEEFMDVDQQLVGLLIGSKGATIHRLQQDTGAKIQVVIEENPEADKVAAEMEGKKRRVRVAGPTQEVVDKAKEAVETILDPEKRTEYLAQAPKDGTQDGKNTVEVDCPSNLTGCILGKGGEIIREISTQTGCRINIETMAPGVEKPMRRIVITGDQEKLPLCTHSVMERLRGQGIIVKMPPGVQSAYQGFQNQALDKIEYNQQQQMQMQQQAYAAAYQHTANAYTQAAQSDPSAYQQLQQALAAQTQAYHAYNSVAQQAQQIASSGQQMTTEMQAQATQLYQQYTAAQQQVQALQAKLGQTGSAAAAAVPATAAVGYDAAAYGQQQQYYQGGMR